ncbi:50S ribosomal protein L11 methyltransferase [Furfurilactobacillus curtus]|uniref:Ribosomal protein L11 methyltransferase n=1 Tax=Furfurilactobacillus curtus TaxID=1746200 RepID=A0ABQ5JL25_9LACO
MKWTGITVNTTNEAVEAVSNILMEAGASGTSIDNAADFMALRPEFPGELLDKQQIPHVASGALVTAYYPETVEIEDLLPKIKRQVSQLTNFGINANPGAVTLKPVAETDWATAWKQYYHPVRVSRYLTVVPSWEKYRPQQVDEKLITLDPGMAFGTGTHPTTALMLAALEITLRGGETVLDVGTGSGVLSIGAKLLGAHKVFAYDVDQVAVDAAISNLALNPVARDVEVSVNNLLTGVTQTADVIVANILAEIIVPLIPQAWPRLPIGGHFLVSGIIEDKHELIEKQLQAEGFKIEQILQQGEWYGIIARKPAEDE